MKTVKLYSVDILLAILFSGIIYSQNIYVHYYIGKSRTNVEKTYGKPLHIDTSTPQMVCMFYQDKTNRFIFVSDNKGVYQAEVYKSYTTKKQIEKDVKNLISKSISNGFEADTITTSDFEIRKRGVKADIQISENKITRKYDLKIKAVRTEN